MTLLRRSCVFCVTVGALTLSSCVPNSPSAEAQRARLADGARVELRDRNGKTIGKLTMALDPDGVRFMGRLTDVPAGPHGFHIHENGKCDAPDFESAGGHFNPSGKQHGDKNPNGPHNGDLGNLGVRVNGTADVSFVAPGVTLQNGPTSLLKKGGTSLVLHEGPDDMLTDPSGNSGARIACGVITR